MPRFIIKKNDIIKGTIPTDTFYHTVNILVYGAGVLLHLIYSASSTQSTPPGCNLQNFIKKGFSRDGNIIIGQMAPLHYSTEAPEISFTEVPSPEYCKILIVRAYPWLLAMIYAVEEINHSSDLLPNITAGYRVYDSCFVEAMALKGTMWLLSGQENGVPNYLCHSQQLSTAIIGDSLSVTTLPMARLLGLYKFPQISYAASLTVFSDKIQFPSFFRTVPHQDIESVGLAQLLVHFGWKWVGILVQDNDFGLLGGQSLKNEIAKSGVCTAFSELIPVLYNRKRNQHIIDVIKQITAHVIIVIATDSTLLPFMEDVSKQNITGKVWIAYHSWPDLPALSNKKYLNTLSGTIGFAFYSVPMPWFKEFLTNIHPFTYPKDALVKAFWEEAFGCKWYSSNNQTFAQVQGRESRKTCTGEEKLNDINSSLLDLSSVRMIYSILNAIYAVVQALHQLLLCKHGEGPFTNRSCANSDNYGSWQLFHYVKNVHFKTTNNEDFYFDENGDSPALFDILNWHPAADGTIQFVKVGIYNNSEPLGHRFILHEESIYWNGGQSKAEPGIGLQGSVLYPDIHFKKETRWE